MLALRSALANQREEIPGVNLENQNHIISKVTKNTDNWAGCCYKGLGTCKNHEHWWVLVILWIALGIYFFFLVLGQQSPLLRELPHHVSHQLVSPAAPHEHISVLKAASFSLFTTRSTICSSVVFSVRRCPRVLSFLRRRYECNNVVG